MEYEEYRGQMAIRRRGKNESKVSFSSIDRIAYMCGTYCYFRRIIFVSRRFAVAVLPFSSNGYYRENVPLNLTYSLLNVSFFFLSRQCPQLPINHRKSALVWIFLLLWCILPSLPTPMVRFCSNNFVRFLFIYCIISWTIYSFWLHFVCCLCFFYLLLFLLSSALAPGYLCTIYCIRFQSIYFAVDFINYRMLWSEISLSASLLSFCEGKRTMIS